MTTTPLALARQEFDAELGTTFTRIVNEIAQTQNWGPLHMRTHAELHIEYSYVESDDGEIVAKPVRAFIKGEDRTWTDLVLEGFHGNSQVALEPTAFQTAQHRYGVDGQWIGQSDRTETWLEEVPLATAQRDRATVNGRMKVTFWRG